MDRCEATWSGPVAPGPSNPTTGLQLPITRARASATTSDARRRRRGPSNVSAARRRAPRSGGAFRAAAEHAVTARRRPALDHQRLVPAERTPQGASGLVRRVDRRRRRPSGPACLAPDDNPQVPALGTPERPESSFCQVSRSSGLPLAEAAADQRPCGLEDPLQRLPVVLLAGRVGGGQVALHVLDGRFEHVEPVVQVVQLRPGDDALRVADPEVLGSAPGLVVPLAAAAPAELPRPSPTAGHLEAAAAPAAPSQLRPPVPCTHHRLYFRHSDEITVTRRCGRYRASGAGARLPARLDAAPAARRARLRPDAADTPRTRAARRRPDLDLPRRHDRARRPDRRGA